MSKLKAMIYLLFMVCIFPFNIHADADVQLKNIDKSIRLRNYTLAVKQLKPLLRAGNAEAQLRMAAIYRSGTGVKRDLKKAMGLYEKASASGHVDAQYTYASLLYKRGNIKQAKYWYQQASTQGHLGAQEKLASMQSAAASDDNPDIKPEQVFSFILHNDTARIKSLIKNNYDFTIFDDKSRTPLMAALLAQNRELATLLLPITERLGHVGKQKNQAIHLAAANGYSELIEEMLKKGVNINAQDGQGNTALTIAVRHDDAQLTRLLLSRKASHRVKNKKRNTSLSLAMARKDPAVLKAFKRQGIDIQQPENTFSALDMKSFRKSFQQSASLYKGWPILSIASLLGEKEIVAQLIKQGEKVHASDKSGYTALHRASSKGQFETVRLLLDAGARVNATSAKKETPLFLAAQTGHLKTVQLLVDNGADSSIITTGKDSALAIAISNGHSEVALSLVTEKLDKESIHEALLLSIQSGMQAVSLKLIPRDRLVNKLDSNKRSVLWHAADLGQEKVCAALILNKPAKIDQKDINGYSPLARAVVKGHRNIAAIMLGKGANLNIRTGENNTLLMLAVISGNQRLVEMFSQKNTDINAKNNVGDTALMLAAASGNDEMIEILIKAGADLKVRNQDELNAYQIALNSGNKESAELIRKRSGRLFKLFN